jgi:hypothetical protein
MSAVDTNPDLIRWLLTALAPDQPCETDFQSISMEAKSHSKVDYMSTIDADAGLIRWLPTALAPGQPCEICSQFMFMKVKSHCNFP